MPADIDAILVAAGNVNAAGKILSDLIAKRDALQAQLAAVNAQIITQRTTSTQTLTVLRQVMDQP